MKSLKGFAVLSLALMVVGIAESHARGRTVVVERRVHHHHRGGSDAGDGFVAGLASALLTSYSLVTSAEASKYDAETLAVEAAAYQDTQVKGAVFEAFANRMREEMAKSMASGELSAIDDASLDEMIADRILEDAAN